jgi:uncharacterized membrane protein
MDSNDKTKKIENENNIETYYESHYHLLRNFFIITIILFIMGIILILVFFHIIPRL